MVLTTHVKELVKNIKNQPKTNILPTPQPQNSPKTTEEPPQVTITNPITNNRNDGSTDFQGYQLLAKLFRFDRFETLKCIIILKHFLNVLTSISSHLASTRLNQVQTLIIIAGLMNYLFKTESVVNLFRI